MTCSARRSFGGVGVLRGAAADLFSESTAEPESYTLSLHAALPIFEVVGELHRQAVVVGVVVPLEPELDRHRVGAGEVDRGFGGVVDTVEFRRAVGIVGDASRNPEGRFPKGGGGAGPGAVGEAGAGGLSHAPVVRETGGGEDRVAVFADFAAVDADRPRRRRGLAAVVGNAQADRVGARRVVAEGDDRVAAPVRLVGPVAVEVTFVFGDRAVGVDGVGDAEADRFVFF